MAESFDVVIVGAGPAGLAAAGEADARGARVVVLDEHDAPGGQIYRGIEAIRDRRPGDLEVLGHDYRQGLATVDAFRESGASYRPRSTVWNAGRDGRIHVVGDGASYAIDAKALIVATGATERPVPVPGWTLPGVMSAGGAQALLKDSGVVPAGPVVLAGSGPLLFLVASQLAAAGADLAAVLRTTPQWPSAQALQCLPRALGAPAYLRKGLAMIAETWRATRVAHGVSELAAEGGDRIERVRFKAGGRREEIEAGVLLLHEGVVPNAQMTRLLECRHAWDTRQHCWRPETDPWGETDIPGVFAAGDCGRIVGAQAAAESGRLAALGALYRCGAVPAGERDARAAPVRRRQARHLRIRPFLDHLYPPSALQDDDGLILCRCEEVTRGQVRDAVRIGCQGTNQVKASTRAGMGPCQGRMCLLSVARAIAGEHGVSPGDIAPYRVRPPLKPIRLEDLAGTPDE